MKTTLFFVTILFIAMMSFDLLAQTNPKVKGGYLITPSFSQEGIEIPVDEKALRLLDFEELADFSLEEKKLFLVPLSHAVMVGDELSYFKSIGYQPVQNPVFYFTGFCEAVQRGNIVFDENSIHVVALGDGKNHLTLHVSTCHGGKKAIHTSFPLGGTWLESNSVFFLCEKLEEQ